MKIIYIGIFLSIIFQMPTKAQTKEQKKQIEKAKRMQDSIMNLPHIKDIMKKAKEMEAEFKKQSKHEQKKEKKPKIKSTNNNSEDSFYWRNTIASDTNSKFKNWSYGLVTIKAGFYDRNKRKYISLDMGTISKEGKINLQLPDIDADDYPFIPITKNYSEGENLFNDNLIYSNDAAKWVSTRFMLEVYNGETKLGSLKIGNTIKPVVNLNSPCCFHKAGDGYALSWVYITQPNSITGKKTSKSGANITHKMQFQKGWNLIKIAVEGTLKDKVYNTHWSNKHHTTLTSLPSDAKYFFIKNN